MRFMKREYIVHFRVGETEHVSDPLDKEAARGWIAEKRVELGETWNGEPWEIWMDATSRVNDVIEKILINNGRLKNYLRSEKYLK